MKKTILTLMACLCCLVFSTHYAAAAEQQALSKTAQRQLNTLKDASPETLENFAKNIYNIEYANPVVSDTLAEILVQRSVQQDVSYMQALEWSAKALGALDNNRYAQTLKYVAKHSKMKRVRKHAAAAYKHLRNKKDVSQYQLGSAKVSID